MSPDPAEYGWWLASRAAGVVALVCVAISVALGLAMAGRVSARPGLARVLLALHRQTALVGLVAIAVHGITLLGDRHLDPGLAGIAVPFVIDHAPLWTGLGVTAGWLAAILGLSYWIRDRIGPARWRVLHRATILVYVLAVAHTLGAGTDAGTPWMRTLLIVTGAPVLFLFVMRVLPAPSRGPSFRRFRIGAITPESTDVMSLRLEPLDGRPPAPAAPGQFVSVRLDVPGAGRLVRSYSLTGEGRISVKRAGTVSAHLHAADVGDVVEVTGPQGAFTLDETGDAPVVLLSAGVGATPVLAMLQRLAAQRSRREVWWLHSARSGSEQAFREEVRELVARLPRGRIHVRYSRPAARDRLGRDYHAPGRFTAAGVLALGVPAEAVFHLCGPNGFLAELTDGLRAAGVPAERLRSERFGPAPASGEPVPAAAVAFSRSRVDAAWDRDFGSLLELAEAHDVEIAAGCRAGACHGCRTGVLQGEVRHDPEPADPPPPGSALLCCARPCGDVVLDA